MSWNYRIIRYDYPCGPNNEETASVYRIHEVYYKADGSIEAWSQDPMATYGESLDELAGDLNYLTIALGKPVLVLVDGMLVETR